MKRIFLLALVVIAVHAAEPVDVLVQGAEKLEVKDVVAALEQPRKIEKGPFSFWIGKIGGHRVAVSLTGQGLLNCTTATILGIEEFSPKLIVNQGTSGAQVPGLKVNDIILGQRTLDYGNFITPVRAAGQGSRPLEWTPVVQRMRAADGRWQEFPEGFSGDAAALAIALRTRNSLGRAMAGVVGSAHEVNLELDRVQWSHRRFGMDVEEMESGHVAALAHVYGIRYVAFRVVSDAPYDGVPFHPDAAHATGLFTVAFLHELPPL
ncbi:MAG TPA: 5'-methylthioadenosine/S-adenosylhomocysteine nucleosidase [Candidatus Didemnitutus sp.]|nr:5'-methylthioadenosine/S-adenosylhomocysteine nucleosidase [Candidatus Didemnitutus sp.]